MGVLSGYWLVCGFTKSNFWENLEVFTALWISILSVTCWYVIFLCIFAERSRQKQSWNADGECSVCNLVWEWLLEFVVYLKNGTFC